MGLARAALSERQQAYYQDLIRFRTRLIPLDEALTTLGVFLWHNAHVELSVTNLSQNLAMTVL